MILPCNLRLTLVKQLQIGSSVGFTLFAYSSSQNVYIDLRYITPFSSSDNPGASPGAVSVCHIPGGGT